VVAGRSQSEDQDMAGLSRGNAWDSDAIIVKYDEGGEVVRKESFGGSGSDVFYGITSSIDGGYTAVGSSSSIDQDMAGLNMDGDGRAVIVQYDVNGEVTWKKSLDGVDASHAFHGVALSGDGGYGVAGVANLRAPLGFSRFGFGNNAALIVKYMDMSEPTGVATGVVESGMCTAIVTLKVNVPIETPKGWERVDPQTFTKVYTENITETITIVGLNGLTGTVQIIVDGIVATPLVPNSGVGAEDCVSAPDTGRNLILGLVVLGEVGFVAAGLAVFFKMRE